MPDQSFSGQDSGRPAYPVSLLHAAAAIFGNASLANLAPRPAVKPALPAKSGE